MSLELKINEDIKNAMLARDQRKLDALRAIKSGLLILKTEKGSDGEIPETLEMSLLQRLVKQRRESAAQYRDNGRADLAEEEEFQADIIQVYLPEQMSEEDILALLRTIISETGASGMKDMGKVMGMASKQLAGKADNKLISGLVRQLLG